MSWFKRKPRWEVEYANNIYDGLVAHNDFGDITAFELRVPTSSHHFYENKILLQREMICFVALMGAAAATAPRLQPVILAFGDLLISKVSARGMQMNRNQLAKAAI